MQINGSFSFSVSKAFSILDIGKRRLNSSTVQRARFCRNPRVLLANTVRMSLHLHRLQLALYSSYLNNMLRHTAFNNS